MSRVLKWVLVGWAAFWVLILDIVLIALIAHEPVQRFGEPPPYDHARVDLRLRF